MNDNVQSFRSVSNVFVRTGNNLNIVLIFYAGDDLIPHGLLL